jgi:hypothetical protein
MSDVPAGKVRVENVNHPGLSTTVDKAKYDAARAALLKALPPRPPGLTQSEMIEATTRLLPEALFPGGEKAGWWTKCVQLDLEAKGLVVRDGGKPLRWTRSPRQRA